MKSGLKDEDGLLGLDMLVDFGLKLGIPTSPNRGNVVRAVRVAVVCRMVYRIFQLGKLPGVYTTTAKDDKLMMVDLHPNGSTRRNTICTYF
jgi:hypothetical protein